MSQEPTADRPPWPTTGDPLFDLLRDPDTRDNPIIRHAIDAMRHYGLSRETALIEMVKALSKHNSELFAKAVVGEARRPIVYHVQGGELMRGE